MLGPKSRPAGAKRPAPAKMATSSSSSSSSSAAAARRQASQSSLLAAGKSTSRSSILSDTSASVCSSSMTAASTKSGPSNRPSCKALPLSSASPAGKTVSSVSSISFGSGCSKQPQTTSKISVLTVGSSNTSSSITSRRVPTLAMSLRDKDQQIKLLIKERDEHKFQAELMARRAEEWEEKFLQSEVEKSHVTSEADDEVVELRRLAQEFEDENKKLVEQLAQKEQIISDIQFKMDEIEIERAEIQNELKEKEEQLKLIESEQTQVSNGKPVNQVITERAISKIKYEKEIDELKEKIMDKEEQMIQLRSSLEMRKNEVINLQSHSSDLERKLKIECERNERHLKRIDEINLELKATEAKLSNKTEENEMYDKQVRTLRQELRSAEEKLEQISLARKKDVDILHSKLSAARRGSTTPTSPQPYKTPTPQDEIVRLQMEIRDLKDQLIDREAELDCNRRDIELMRRKMETRTLEVDCNNQELARRCQDLLEQNRQSEDTVKQLLKSTTEHSAQLMRATEDLKEANGKCIKLREEINELEYKLDEENKKANQFKEDNDILKHDNEQLKEQADILRNQIDSLNEQLSDLCQQLDVQANTLFKDREVLADRLTQNEINSAQMKHDLATARQDLRTSKIQSQEALNERDRLKADIEIKEKYIRSRNDIIETLRHEILDLKKSLGEYKQKFEDSKLSTQNELDGLSKELKEQLENVKQELVFKTEECSRLMKQCEQLQKKLDEDNNLIEEEQLKQFDEMRQKHSQELDQLNKKLKNLEDQLEEARSSTLKRHNNNTSLLNGSINKSDTSLNGANDQQQNCSIKVSDKQKRKDYETQIEFLNSVVVDMQKECDDYKSKLAQMETMSIMNEFDNLILTNQTLTRASSRRNQEKSSLAPMATLTRRIRNDKLDRPTTRISARPYCDICNVYDLHHTIYCPKVSEKLASRRSQVEFAVVTNSSTNNINNNNNNNNNNDNNIINSYNNNNNNEINVHKNNAHDDNAIINNNGNKTSSNVITVDELFKDYEQSLESVSNSQFSSLRRTQTIERNPRPYCDHCDLFGHTIKSCNLMKA